MNNRKKRISARLQTEIDWIPMSQRGIFRFVPHVPSHVSARGGRAVSMDNRQSIAACVCTIGFMVFTLAAIFLIMIPNVSQEIYILALLGLFSGFILLIGGVMLLRRSSSDARRVYEIVSESEEISLESISRATDIPVSRVQLFIEMAIYAKQVKGRIIDGMYIEKLVAERIDDSTVRCPHCHAELDLEDEF